MSKYLKTYYGITMKQILSKKREVLLNDLEEVPCPQCQASEGLKIADRDKYNLAINTVLCQQCAQLYLNPRPTNNAYTNFYEGGGGEDSVYHLKVTPDNVLSVLKSYLGEDFKPIHDREEMESLLDHSVEELSEVSEEAYRAYGEDIVKSLQHVVSKGAKVFEMGASEGQLLLPWRDLLEAEVGGVEPKRESVRVAREKYNVELIQGFSDHPDIPEESYDLVMINRTLDHMMDPLGDLKRAWSWLKPDGYLFIDVKHFLRRSANSGLEKVIEIDHVSMYMPQTLRSLMQRAGFEVVEEKVKDVSGIYGAHHRKDICQLRILGKKSNTAVRINEANPLDVLAEIQKTSLEHTRKLNASLDQQKAEIVKLKESIRGLKKKHLELKEKFKKKRKNSA